MKSFTSTPRVANASRKNIRCQASAEPKTAVITGSNTGIGFETAKALVTKGYNVVIACRDEAKGRSAVERIRAAVPSASSTVEFSQLDLADLGSVKDFANRYLDSGKPIDILCNNAGVMAPPLLRTKDGFELQIGVNHLGHYALTMQLLPRILESKSSRIVNVSSTAHLFGQINFDDLNSNKSYSAWREYGQSKLANILFTYELARRLPNGSNCTVNTLHPGVVATELQRYMIDMDNIQWWQRPALEFMKNFILTPEQGAQTSIHLCSSSEVEGLSSKYFDNCRPVASSAASYNLDSARRLFDLSAELTNVSSNVVGSAKQAKVVV